MKLPITYRVTKPVQSVSLLNPKAACVNLISFAWRAQWPSPQSEHFMAPYAISLPIYSVGAAVLSRGSHNPAGPVSTFHLIYTITLPKHTHNSQGREVHHHERKAEEEKETVQVYRGKSIVERTGEG